MASSKIKKVTDVITKKVAAVAGAAVVAGKALKPHVAKVATKVRRRKV